MTRQLCGCLDAPQTAECGVGAWSEAKIREFKLLALDHRHLACAKARLDPSLVLVTELLHAAGPLIARELGWSRLDLLARKVNRQAGCDAGSSTPTTRSSPPAWPRSTVSTSSSTPTRARASAATSRRWARPMNGPGRY